MLNFDEKHELYELIKSAVKAGVLEAMKESMKESGEGQYPDSERPKEPDAFGVFGETPNAKAYLGRLSKKLNISSPMYRSDLCKLKSEMKGLLSENEIKFVLTHLNQFPEKRNLFFSGNVDDFMEIVNE